MGRVQGLPPLGSDWENSWDNPSSPATASLSHHFIRKQGVESWGREPSGCPQNLLDAPAKHALAWVAQLQAGCGWWVASRTSQHWPEEGSVVSGHVSRPGSALLAVCSAFWGRGARGWPG